MDKKKYRNYRRIILGVIGATALLSVAMVAPNALQMLKIFDERDKQKYGYKINTKLSSMIKDGFLKFKEGDLGNKYLELTPKGRLELLKYQKTVFKKPKRWDGIWRVVIFDIPKNKNRLRDVIRFHLKKIGFIQLQKSVWVFPYNCEEIILLLKTNFKFGKEVLYMKVKSLENDKAIRKQFFPKDKDD